MFENIEVYTDYGVHKTTLYRARFVRFVKKKTDTNNWIKRASSYNTIL